MSEDRNWDPWMDSTFREDDPTGANSQALLMAEPVYPPTPLGTP